ncbi:MAG TPA: hypothetical protein VNI83_14125 [Vicinamibacterales bacterium]|nr:hypothetical protein [Vicinamibacterales bacterium]
MQALVIPVLIAAAGLQPAVRATGRLRLTADASLCRHADAELLVRRRTAALPETVFRASAPFAACEWRLAALAPGDYEAVLLDGDRTPLGLAEFVVAAGAAVAAHLPPAEAALEGWIAVAALPPPPGTRIAARYERAPWIAWEVEAAPDGSYRLPLHALASNLVVSVRLPGAINEPSRIVPAGRSARADFEIPAGVLHIEVEPEAPARRALLLVVRSRETSFSRAVQIDRPRRWAFVGSGYGECDVSLKTLDGDRTLARTRARVTREAPEARLRLTVRPPDP